MEEKRLHLWSETLIKVIDAGYDAQIQQKSLLNEDTLHINTKCSNKWDTCNIAGIKVKYPYEVRSPLIIFLCYYVHNQPKRAMVK